MNLIISDMWREIAKYFNKYPKRKKIAQKFLEYGIRITNNRIYCGDIELSHSKIARAFDVDRRIITDTLEVITKSPELHSVYSRLRPTCHLKDVASQMSWGVIEIIPVDPGMPGILADVATIIASNSISIRQAIVDDFELSEEPRLFIITENQIPGNLIQKIREAKGVKAVLIY
jgi:predicted regulator of amino acid metabolism with ACT domain